MFARGDTVKAIDYATCTYGASTGLFRGPQRQLRGEYIAFIGSTETFGRFIEAPYPDLVEANLGMTAINLGSQNAGVEAFVSSQPLIDICARASATVVEVMGAPNMSNRHYTVDPRRNVLCASKTLKSVYPEIEFRGFETTADLLTGLARVCPKRLHIVRQELQTAWVARMRTLIDLIGGPVVLLWAADHIPFSHGGGGTICRDPVFIDRAMLNAVAPRADALTEIVVTREEIEAGRSDMIFDRFEEPAAHNMLGPVAHHRIAGAVTETLAGLLNIDIRPVPIEDSLRQLQAG